MRSADCGINFNAELGIRIAEYYRLVFCRAVLIEETVIASI